MTYVQGILNSIMMKQFHHQNPVILPTVIRDAESSATLDVYQLRLREALHFLTQLSLITHHEGTDSYSMHPLVHTWVRERPQMKAREQAVWCEIALHTLSRCVLLPPLNESVDSHGDLARKLLPHIISVSECQQKVQREFWNKRYKRSRPWPALESRLSPYRAMFLAKSAFVFSECSNFVETERCLRPVMEFNHNFLGSNHPRTERVALALSDTLQQQCRVNEAADLQEQVFFRNLKALGQDHPRTLILMDRLGESRRQQGRLAESMELLTKAVRGMKAQLPDTDPATYHALEQLGITLRNCLQFEDAKDRLEQAVAGMKRLLGESDLRTLMAREELAIAYKELGTMHLMSDKALAQQCLDTAYKHAKFVLEQRTERLGDKQPYTWHAQGTLSRIKASMGYVDEAEKTFSSTLPVAGRHLGDDHLLVLSHRNYHCKILI